jgi:fumarate hydratase subunit beta
MPIQINLPMTPEQRRALRAGDKVLLSGTIYTARDAAHKRMTEALERGEALPFDLRDAVVYYAGPSPARPGKVIGAAGPTTSYRMDAYAPALLDRGLAAMIGKGPRSPEVLSAMRRNEAVYFAAVGGAGALMAKSILAAHPVAYEDLGTEAILALEVRDFPVLVAADCVGGDLYQRSVNPA